MRPVDVDLKKRYWVIWWPMHDAEGGLRDVESTFDTLSEAIKEYNSILNKYTCCVVEIFDSGTCEFVEIGRGE